MKKFRYNINNLDCANCARKIEDSLSKNDDLINVCVNFNTMKLSYECDREVSVKEVNDIINSIEPGVFISNEKVDKKKEFHLSILIVALVVGLIAYFVNMPKFLRVGLYVVSYSLFLYRTTWNAIKLLFKSKTINENLLITISCVGALVIGEVLEGMMVISLYTIGKILEEKAVNNSRRSIKDLLDIKEPYANRLIDKKEVQVLVEDIEIGDILIVKKGEKIPVDGVITKGNTLLDTSALTGESELLKVNVNDNVLSGSINVGDVIEIKVLELFENSTVNKILELLEEATDKKTKTETLISKISKVYTPLVIVFAITIIFFMPILSNVSRDDAVYRALTFLVIACPCAIAISVPLSYFTGIGVASKKGILIKGSNFLDNLSNSKNIIFDKTGTLTNGSFTVTDIKVTDENYSRDEVIDILMKGESLSNHPIAKSIMKLKNDVPNSKDVKNYREEAGKGISFTLDGKKVSIGNALLCGCGEDAMLHLSIDNKHIASISIDDGVKENAKEVIDVLKSLNIKTFMFTGDNKDVALSIGKKLGIDNISYEMLPTDKYRCYEDIASKSSISVFVGDGINDAPVLKRADIGISMGGVGSDSAIEASDIVLMKDDLTRIPLAYDISKYTKKIIKQNLIFAMGIKLSILLCSVFGLANMWLAVFADTGVTLLTILNTLRILRKYK